MPSFSLISSLIINPYTASPTTFEYSKIKLKTD
jgi:hypothetical protein